MHRALLVLFLSLIAFPLQVSAQGDFFLEKGQLVHDGKERLYRYFIPPRLKASGKTAPVVFVLHGGGGNGENAATMTGFTKKALKEGFLVVYPNGTGRFPDRVLTWNVDHCCGKAMEENADDIGFISKLIDEMIRTHGADPDRVYVTGMSNGGMMTQRIGRELSGKVTAIAPVVSGLFGDEAMPASKVSALIINGGIDKSIPVAGGQTGGKFASSWDGTQLMPAAYQGEFWRKANGCDADPQTQRLARGEAPVKIWDYDCPSGVDVVRYLVLDNGHAWPGGKGGHRRSDEPSTTINATDVIWDFFKTKTR